MLTCIALLVPRESEACGGTFCDAGPQAGSMQVDQTGETILFAHGGGFVEAHVQIQYDGADASEFAWIVPVPEVPEIEVGSFRLIQAALDATVPEYSLTSSNTCNGGGGNGSAGFISFPDAGGGGGPPPQVVVHDTVGVFEYVVLQGGTSASIGQWLADNDYANDDEAPDILDAYIDEGHVFVAFKLRHFAGIEDLHPVVIRYPGDEACIPLRLTRIAARDNMPIRALFLGEARVMPVNYRHVMLNRVRLDWANFGANYDALVSMAIDAPGSDGRGFVTEYAGASAVVEREGLSTAPLDSEVFEALPPTDVTDVLRSQGLLWCGPSECDFRHELVASLLHEFLPVPAGVEEAAFYDCPECYADQIDHDAWDGPAFAAAYHERIVGPLEHANVLLDNWPYLTRLYTRISPHEMIYDPTFVESSQLGDVPNRFGAMATTDCCGTEVRLPGGRTIELSDPNAWPPWPDAMPWAERIEEMQPSGVPALLVNESDEIDAFVSSYNALQPCGEGGTGGTSTTADSGGGSDNDGGAVVTSGTDSSGPGELPVSDGCGCRSSPRPAVFGIGLLLFACARRRRG